MMAKNIVLDRTFKRAADQVLDRFARSDRKVTRARIWLFEDEARRRALEGALAKQGIEAHVYSAYKPLVHFFLEEVDRNGLTAVVVGYPVHPDGTDIRFRLEAYPLVRMLPDVSFTWNPVAVPAGDTDSRCWYSVCLRYGDKAVDRRVLAPNVVYEDFLGRRVLAPSAWLVAHEGEGGSTVHVPLACEYRQCYDAVMAAVKAHHWGGAEPYFNRLVIQACLPGIERPLAVGQECISTTEAMHEDLYFSLLEFFQNYSGRAQGSRGLQPGQIIPDIRLTDTGVAMARVTVEPVRTVQEKPFFSPSPALDRPALLDSLAAVSAPMPQADVEEALGQFEGRHFVFASHQGRPVHGVHINGAKPAVLISGAQHANETSGVVGALRAAAELRRDPDAHLVLMPLENPDGYALHQALCKHNPRHMHHAARYTALGDDVEYRERAPWFERQGRDHAFSISGAGLHLNLHGYPAHEWTRPCTGYLPRGFELWGIPKGFFLIFRYRPGQREKACALLNHLARELAKDEVLADFNARQLDAYRRHANAMPFEVMHGVPYMASAVEGLACDVTLITEFPDETIHGGDFVFAHTVQCEAVKIATRWWWGE